MRIYEKLGNKFAEVYDIADTDPFEIMNFRNLIFGIPTWGIGELQDNWIEYLPLLEKMDLRGKTAALFGLGDQESYPDTSAWSSGGCQCRGLG